jgi:hypothetical protein
MNAKTGRAKSRFGERNSGRGSAAAPITIVGLTAG